MASRPNLTVLTEAFVEEVIIEKVAGEWAATGARFSRSGLEYRAQALREVIICCGSVQSPQLLEISGVGNPSILQAAGIDVKVPNLNVGENLQEHMSKFEFSTRLFTFPVQVLITHVLFVVNSDSNNLRNLPRHHHARRFALRTGSPCLRLADLYKQCLWTFNSNTIKCILPTIQLSHAYSSP